MLAMTSGRVSRASSVGTYRTSRAVSHRRVPSYLGNWRERRKGVTISHGDTHAKSHCCFGPCDLMGRQFLRSTKRSANGTAGVDRNVLQQDAGDLRKASAHGDAHCLGEGRRVADVAAVFRAGEPTADAGSKFKNVRDRVGAAH